MPTPAPEPGKGQSGGASQPQASSAANQTFSFETLMSEIVLILEDHLGKDHDELGAIAQALKEVLKKRLSVNADQPIS